MRVLFNHLGYRPGRIEGILLEASAEATWERVEIVALPQQRPVLALIPEFAGAVEGWTCGPWWRLPACELPPGRYAVRWSGSPGGGQSEGFAVDPASGGPRVWSDLLFYFKGQRCTGIWDRADRQAPRTDDRAPRDVHGGWYDASGDVSKYLSHLSYTRFLNPQQTPLLVWVLARAWQRLRAAGAPDFFLARLRDEALHGADFLVRMQDPSGFFYQTVFDQWSKDPTRRELCAYRTQAGERLASYEAGWSQGGGMAIAALAAAVALGDGDECSAEDYRAAALRGFAHLEERGEAYREGGKMLFLDALCALLAATELRALGSSCPTGPRAEVLAGRFAHLRTFWRPVGGRLWWSADEEGAWSWSHASDEGLPLIVLARLAEVEPTLASPSGELAIGWVSALLELRGEANNPFGYPPHWVVTPEMAPRRQWFFPQENPSGYWWQGENARLASLASGLLAWVPAHGEDGPTRAAVEAWLGWILGRNPFDICMLQGHGRHNPDYARGYENAPGGVCNGITAAPGNEADIAFAPLPQADDPAQQWRWTEQWLPHGTWLFDALVRRGER
jgi:hypothetical protein